MIKHIITLAVICIVSTTTHFAQSYSDMAGEGKNFFWIQDTCNKQWLDKDLSTVKGWKNFKRWEYFWEKRVLPNGDFPNPDIVWNEWVKLKNRKSDLGKKTTNQLFASPKWKLVGPINKIPTGGGAGRVNVIRFNPEDGEQVWLGTPAGGLWKSSDFGNSWSTSTDSLLNLGVSDIAINPQNTQQMFIATGDGDGGHTYSYGVLRSDDGGKRWVRTGLNYTLSQTIQTTRLLINPNQPNVLLCGTSGGLFRTTNSGETWSAVQGGSIKDLEFQPGNPNVVYATSGVSIYKSVNGGVNWQKMTSGLTGISGNRTAIAVTEANPNYIYALVSNNQSGFGGLYRSTNSGDSWELRVSGTSINILNWSVLGTYDPFAEQQGQGYYDLSIAVSAVNPEVVYCGGVNIWRSSDGGKNWQAKSHWQGVGAPYVHADIHDLIFVPGAQNPEYLCAASDGGIFFTKDNGNSWNDLSDGLQILQFYKIGVDPSNPGTVLGGSQDNGTNRYQSGSWKQVNGADGMEALFEAGGNYAYSTIYYGSLYRSSTNGQSFSTQRVYPQPGLPTGAWVSPVILNPMRQTSIYIGVNQRIYRSTDRGDTWFRLSNTGFSGSVKSLSISANDTAQIWATTDNRVWRSTNSGSTFMDVSSGGPTNNISNCATNPSKSGQAAVTISGFNPNAKVYLTKDGGTTWNNITKTGLPNVPILCAMFSPSGTEDVLFVGTDLGVFYTKESLTEWIDFNDGLPNVIVNDLELNGNLLRAGTYGRGLWEVTIDKALQVTEDIVMLNNIHVFPNPTTDVFSVTGNAPQETVLKLRLIDIQGKEVFNTTQVIHEGTFTKELSLVTKVTGVYTLEITMNDKIGTVKIIKE